ncbi:NAD(+) diphosphatase [Hallella sp.]|uniref:NAD(+) diphosphatase n=1 Tax=Hallella sp. TaxID=2980186 RepID=UPI0028431A0F|nr:NAD(+) diphosphatase [Hallella sp.]MDR3844813.1 NAD(+) diphosphatase [Hallella sp.]
MKRYYFIFSKNNILLEQQPNGTFTIPCAEEVPIGIHPWTHVLNISPMDDGTEVKALMVDDPKSIEATDDQLRMDGWVFKSLRESFYHLPEPLYLKAGKCEELLYWDHNTQFCGVCGAPMKMSTDISKRCTQCGKEVWPQLATAVIVLIRKGDEVLLVHARNFASDFYGLVAGFVETGETLEEAVRREVMEETGLTIKNLTYFGSQPWPYPCGLMVGYMADYDEGAIHLQRSELSKGNWFRYDQMPRIPQKLSIARRLIDAWLKSHGVTSSQE